MDSITMELDYTRYLEACIEEQFDMERCVHEALALSESFDEFKNLESFTEAATGKIRAAWEKFKAWIKKAWAAFLERLTKTFNGAQGYLDKYKDIILTKKPKEGYTVTMPDHNKGIDRIYKPTIIKLSNSEVYEFGEMCQKKAMTYNNEDDYNKDLNAAATLNESGVTDNFPGMKSIIETYRMAQVTDFADNTHVLTQLKTYYLGGEPVTIPTTDFNMKDLFDWCYNQEKIKKNIETEQENFSTNCDVIVTDFERAARDAESKFKEKQATQQTAQNPGEEGTDSQTAKNQAQTEKAKADANRQAELAKQRAYNADNKLISHNNAAISALYGGIVIHEAPDPRTPTGTQQTSSQTTTKTSDNGNQTLTTTAKYSTVRNDTTAANRDTTKNSAEALANKVAVEGKNITWFINVYKATINTYKRLAADVFTAKANATIAISKDYMDIIRAHVNDYVGTKDNVADNQAAPAATNRDNGNAPQPQNNQQPAQA